MQNENLINIIKKENNLPIEEEKVEKKNSFKNEENKVNMSKISQKSKKNEEKNS